MYISIGVAAVDGSRVQHRPSESSPKTLYDEICHSAAIGCHCRHCSEVRWALILYPYWLIKLVLSGMNARRPAWKKVETQLVPRHGKGLYRQNPTVRR
jgi:hypothetical protein